MSVETGSLIDSIGATAGPAAMAEMSSSFSSPSFSAESRSFSPGLSNGIPKAGEIFNSAPSISSFEDGSIISSKNPFGIETLENPFGEQNDFSAEEMTNSRVHREATEIVEGLQGFTESPLASYDIISHAEEIARTASIPQNELDEFGDIPFLAEEILRESRLAQAAEITSQPNIDQMEITADIAQAQRTIDAVMAAGLDKEFAMQAVGPALEAKGLTLTETETEVGVEIVKKLRIAQMDREKIRVPNYIVDIVALGEREKNAYKAVSGAFSGKKPDEEVTGASIAERIPQAKPYSKIMSRINLLDDPTPEYVRHDVEAIGVVKDEGEAQNKIIEINKRHVPVSLDYHGKYVAEDDVRKVTRGKKLSDPTRLRQGA